MLDSRRLGEMLDSRRLGGMLDSRRPIGMLDFRRPDGILSLVLPMWVYEEHVLEFAPIFWSAYRLVFWESLSFLNIKKKRSDLTSRLSAVSCLDLLYVSENRGFGIM